jgi:tripartite-type tricarboxylate transporter receptor subunit TctC
MSGVQAQTTAYPNKPIKIIVPFPPGGGIDVLIRAVGKELSDQWKQSVIVDNKAGAATFIGTEGVARSDADGYTLLATTDPTFTSNPHLFKKLPYDATAGFEPIIQMVKGDNIIFAHPSVPVRDLKGLVEIAKSKGTKFSFASYGNGTQPQLVFGYLNEKEKTDLLHIPYKGIAPVMMAVAGHEVDLSVASAGVAGEMIKAQRIRPIAIAGSKRHPMFPEVPTVSEQGFPYLQSFIWYGLFAPAGTPMAVVEKLNAAVAAILKNPKFAQEQVVSKGMTVVAGSPKEFNTAIRQDLDIVGEMVRASKIQPE